MSDQQEILDRYNSLEKYERLESWRTWLANTVYVVRKKSPECIGHYVRLDVKFTDVLLEAICNDEDPEGYLISIYGEDFIVENMSNQIEEGRKEYYPGM